MKCSDERNLKYYIDAVSFCALDSSLFLDTHPKDEEAMTYFVKYNQARNQAIHEYSARFNPLLTSQITEMNYSQWVNTPWPWEMEG